MIAVNALADMSKGTTLNVGVISGGDAANIVADHAEAMLDLRFWDNEEYQRVNQGLSTCCGQPFLDGVSCVLEQEAHTPAMSPSANTEMLMTSVEQAGREVGVNVTWQAVGGGSDANHTAALGIPSLDGFGPIGANFHSPSEYLVLDSIEPRIRLLRRVISNM